jgi:hypothetical protein
MKIIFSVENMILTGLRIRVLSTVLAFDLTYTNYITLDYKPLMVDFPVVEKHGGGQSQLDLSPPASPPAMDQAPEAASNSSGISSLKS